MVAGTWGAVGWIPLPLASAVLGLFVTRSHSSTSLLNNPTAFQEWAEGYIVNMHGLQSMVDTPYWAYSIIYWGIERKY